MNAKGALHTAFEFVDEKDKIIISISSMRYNTF